jgi:HTH-type transcriptional regulator/antitoxin HigA
MLATAAITQAAGTLTTNLPYLAGIDSEGQYNDALALMDELIEQYDTNIVLIEALGNVISRYEEECEAFEYLNRRQADIDPGVATIKVLMDQHGLSISDFENEIGKKSLVSLILAGKRNLTRDHILRLSKRFSIKPALFF